MKKIFALMLLIPFLSQGVQAKPLKEFLKSCAVGTMGGATLGVISLALEDKPSESWNNVARGASLGLYAGIAYGLYTMGNSSATGYQEPDFAIMPTFDRGKIDGVQVSKTLFDF